LRRISPPEADSLVRRVAPLETIAALETDGPISRIRQFAVMRHWRPAT